MVTRVQLPAYPRVAVLGDSAIAGYGVNGRSYAQIAAEQLNASRTMFFARSHFTVFDSLRLFHRVQTFEPDLLLIGVGGSDSLVHAGKTIERLLERFAPKSWQGTDGLDLNALPPPTPTKRGQYRHRITGLIKLALKHIGIRISGGYRQVEPKDFEPAYTELIKKSSELGCVVVVIAIHHVGTFLWPRSAASADEFEAVISRVLVDYPNIIRIDPKTVLAPGDFLIDQAHFAASGHEKVAELLMNELMTTAGATESA